MIFCEHNPYNYTQTEIKGIFKHKQSKIVNLGKLIFNFFHENSYMSIKYDLIRN